MQVDDIFREAKERLLWEGNIKNESVMAEYLGDRVGREHSRHRKSKYKGPEARISS